MLPLQRQVGDEEAGRRLDVVLAGWLGESRSRAQARILAGEVLLDGAPAAKSGLVVAGQRVQVAQAPVEDQPAPPVVPIRWQDEHLAVVAKPADLVVHHGAGVRGATLVEALRAQGVALAAAADPDRPGIVHRLDRGTSGLLVVASTEAALVGLQAMFKVHDVEREYWALVEGHPDSAEATIDAPIQRHPSNRTIFTVAEGGRRAVSHYRVIATHPGTAEVAVTLETGRTHQVRVHLKAIGHPVAGDLFYGASPKLRARLGLERQALHARRLAFAHPVTGAPIDIEEPLPPDLDAARGRAAD